MVGAATIDIRSPNSVRERLRERERERERVCVCLRLSIVGGGFNSFPLMVSKKLSNIKQLSIQSISKGGKKEQPIRREK